MAKKSNTQRVQEYLITHPNSKLSGEDLAKRIGCTVNTVYQARSEMKKKLAKVQAKPKATSRKKPEPEAASDGAARLTVEEWSIAFRAVRELQKLGDPIAIINGCKDVINEPAESQQR